MSIKINVAWLKEPNFDEKYATYIHILKDGKPWGYKRITSWMDERDVMEVVPGYDRWLELRRWYTPAHARWINDDAHKLLEKRMRDAPTQ